MPTRTTDTSNSAAGVATVALSFALWGVLPAYWKRLEGVPALQIAAFRTIWTLLVAAGLLLLWRRRGELRAAVTSVATLSRLSLAAAMLGTNWFIFILGVNTGRMLETSLGYYINPLVSVLFGTVLLRERLRPMQIVAVALAVAGVANLVVQQGSVPWLALVLAVSFALYGLIRKTTDVGPLPGLVVEMAILTVPAAIFLGVLHARGVNAMVDGTWTTRGFLAVGGIVTAAPLLLFAYGVKRIGLSTVGFLQYLAPSCMLAQAVLLYGEQFTRTRAITFGMIWAALAVFTFDSLRRSR